MPSLKLRKPFRYRRQSHAAGAMLDVEARHVKLLTGLGIVEKPAAKPKPTQLPAPPPPPTPPTDTDADAAAAHVRAGSPHRPVGREPARSAEAHPQA